MSPVSRIGRQILCHQHHLLMRVKEESEKAGTQHSKDEDFSIQSQYFMANRRGKSGSSDRLFSWAPKSL